ncbi:MAG: hypothetical protein SOW44_07050 [Porphyromonas sp.]|nr:hypothetical protein [Porphyromonas sp.]
MSTDTGRAASLTSSRIAVHGTPKGLNIFPPGDESGILRQFYQKTESDLDELMRVELAQNRQGSWECVYTFLRFNLLDFTGRPGSYLGLSVFTNKYYGDLSGMYDLLKMLFKKYFVGELISADGRKFEIPDFGNKSELFHKLEAAFDAGVDARSFRAIDTANPGHNVGNKASFHRDEVSASLAMEVVFSGGVVEVNTATPLGRERETLSKLQSIRDMYKEETDKMHAAHTDELRQLRETLDREIEHRDRTIVELGREKASLQTSLDSLTQKLGDVQSKLKETAALLDSDGKSGDAVTGQLAPKTVGGSKSGRTSLWTLIYRVLVLLLLISVLYLIIPMASQGSESSLRPVTSAGGTSHPD